MDHTYTSHKVLSDNATLFPTEFLNFINASGLPLACLTLKPGCPLMLLHNIDPTNSLCNGTHMILLEIRPMVLRCCILGGDYTGNEVFIPRITIDAPDDLPVNLYCCQFPICLTFVMTINKSQGQSIINVNIDLCSPVFSHGQLYVALSRCTAADRIKVISPQDSDTTHTSNVIFTEVLAGLTNP